MSQNIYDNEKFFNSYKSLRERDDNYNILFEQPAMKKMLPDLTDKTVLDIGCGFGINCMGFINAGAKFVTGVDISQNMLTAAKEQNSHENIEYINMDMKEILSLNKKYDFIYSSLAFHYEEDFERLSNDIYTLLNDGGILLFSQEHPICTASQGLHQNKLLKLIINKQKEYILQNYNIRGLRKDNWFVENVEKYHRPFSDIINTLCKAGFKIEAIGEPLPCDEALRKRPGLKKEFIRPSFLIVKAIKDKRVELWDAYNRNFEKIENTTPVRGRSIPDGMYHLVSEIAVRHTDGTYLLMQRDLNKHLGGMWELSAGGSALQGETAIECAARELCEETGIKSYELQETGRFTNDEHHTIYTEYLCITDCDKNSITLQPGETIAYKWVTYDELSSIQLASTRILNLL